MIVIIRDIVSNLWFSYNLFKKKKNRTIQIPFEKNVNSILNIESKTFMKFIEIPFLFLLLYHSEEAIYGVILIVYYIHNKLT